METNEALIAILRKSHAQAMAGETMSMDEVKIFMKNIGAQLTEYGSKKKEEPLKPYTMDEIYSMLSESKLQIAKGETLTDDEVWSKYEKEM